jgi:uncharacterized membrane protein YbaN (DUF454 family)
MKILSSNTKRSLLIAAGTIFLGLGILGIFLPLVPTTPFLLLAAACYANSSEKMYRRLLQHRWFGNYLKNYREQKRIPFSVKIVTIVFLWLTIGFSGIFVVHNLWIRIGLMAVAVGVTVHILSIRTLKRKQ